MDEEWEVGEVAGGESLDATSEAALASAADSETSFDKGAVVCVNCDDDMVSMKFWP